MHNLYARYCADEIYTAVGGIVVSLNPYKPLPLYGEAQMAGYRRAAGAGTLPEQPPHVYGTAQCAYSDLLDDNRTSRGAMCGLCVGWMGVGGRLPLMAPCGARCRALRPTSAGPPTRPDSLCLCCSYTKILGV